MRFKQLLSVAAVALASSAATLIAEHVLQPTVAAAQSAATMQEFALYAGHRKDTDKNESFIFYNSRTGDIWVYEDQKVKEHYRVKAVGEDLEKVQ